MSRAPAYCVTKPRGVPERPSEKKRAKRALVLAALPGTAVQVQRKTGCGQATVSRWLADLKVAGEAHVGGWRRGGHGGPFAERWVRGPGEDVPCPLVALSPAERNVKRRAREAAERDDRARRLAAVVVRRDPMVAAFFGPSSRCEQHWGASA